MKNVLRIIGIALIAIAFSFTNNSKRTLIVDVGHGGQDNGASVNGISEKEVVLSIAKTIKTMSKNTNVDVILTRDQDHYTSLTKRAKDINTIKADYVISLHANRSKDTKKRGKEIFIYDKNPQYKASKSLAHRLSESFKPQKIEIQNQNLYLLRNVEHPIAVMELGYLSNEQDRKELTSKEEQQRIAKRILDAVQ